MHENPSIQAEAEPTTAPAAPADPATYRGPDRRARPTPRWSRYTFLGGRRRGGRRQGESDGSFVDQYSLRMWLLLVWVALMNAGDSFFTLLHLQDGGIELNPVAEMMLQTGRTGFVALKSFLITVPLAVLCLHKNFPLARIGLWVAAGTYSVLLAYHVSLL
jgi:hypothetical protein